MENADAWVLKELLSLQFRSYQDLLPRVSESMAGLRQVESQFVAMLADSLTKRQAVAFGLLSRTFQLGISCLVNQLLQNYAGWNCSYRSLLETYFVTDWINQDPQRFEAYFEEGSTPSIGPIKNDCCGRRPEFASVYKRLSEVTHVGSRALHLPRKRRVETANELPFTATSMNVAGSELAEMLTQFAELLELLRCRLEELLVENFDSTKQGEILWAGQSTKAKFGCLGWEPRL